MTETLARTPIMAQEMASDPAPGDTLYAQTLDPVPSTHDSLTHMLDVEDASQSLWPQHQEPGPQKSSILKPRTHSSIPFGDPRLAYNQHSLKTSYQAFYNMKDLKKPRPKVARDDLALLSEEETLMVYQKATDKIGKESLNTLIRTLQERLAAKVAKGSNNAFMLRKLFKSIDEDQSGHIDHSEFVTMMETFGMQLNQDQALALMAQYDKDGSGSLEYDEFMKDILDPDYYKLFAGGKKVKKATASQVKEREAVLEAKLKQIKKTFGNIVISKCRQMSKMFRAFDEDKDGMISRDELAAALRAYAIRLSDAEIDFIFSKLDKDGNGCDYNEFFSFFGVKGL